VFSQRLFEVDTALSSFFAVLVFCGLSGAVYAFNDVRDVTADRLDPVKRKRPIASGELSERAALWVSALLTLTALPLAAVIDPWLGLVALLYVSNNLAYSLYLKRIAFVDVLIIATGFLLRVLAGAFAIGVPVSGWLLACTGLLSALLGFGKRAHELGQIASSRTGRAHSRGSLAGYSLTTLRVALFVLAAATVGTYAFYSLDERTVSAFGSGHLIYTLPFCALGILRFLQLALWKPKPESPTDAMLRDPLFLLNLAFWGTAVLFIIYWARS